MDSRNIGNPSINTSDFKNLFEASVMYLKNNEILSEKTLECVRYFSTKLFHLLRK